MRLKYVKSFTHKLNCWNYWIEVLKLTTMEYGRKFVHLSLLSVYIERVTTYCSRGLSLPVRHFPVI